jgi:hypothetical protein
MYGDWYHQFKQMEEQRVKGFKSKLDKTMRNLGYDNHWTEEDVIEELTSIDGGKFFLDNFIRSLYAHETDLHFATIVSSKWRSIFLGLLAMFPGTLRCALIHSCVFPLVPSAAVS